MKAMTCRAVAEEFATIGCEASGRWRVAYDRVAAVLAQHRTHKARAIRKLRGLAKRKKTPCDHLYAMAARYLTGTPAD